MGCALAAAEEQAAVSAFFAGGVQELDLTQDSSPNELLAARGLCSEAFGLKPSV